MHVVEHKISYFFYFRDIVTLMVDITEIEKLQLAQGMTSESKIKELSKEDGMAYSIIKMMLLLLSGLEIKSRPWHSAH